MSDRPAQAIENAGERAKAEQVAANIFDRILTVLRRKPIWAAWLWSMTGIIVAALRYLPLGHE